MKQISRSDQKLKRLHCLSAHLSQLIDQGRLFEMSKHEKVVWDKKVQDLTDKIKKLETEIEKFKVNKFYRRRRPTEAQRILFIPTTLEDMAGKRIEKLILRSQQDIEKWEN